MSTDDDELLCAYCGEPATTADHIPPESLFTPPRPNNLITVPACGRCNNGASIDDEIFRNEMSIMSGSFGGSANAAERLKTSLRGVRRNKIALKKIVLGATRVERYSPGGIYLGHGFKVPANKEAHQRVLKRIVRGLYWYQYKTPLCANIEIELTYIDRTRPRWQEHVALITRLASQHFQVGNGDTFQFSFGRAVDDHRFSVWLLIFFKGPSEQIFIAHTKGPIPSGLEQTTENRMS